MHSLSNHANGESRDQLLEFSLRKLIELVHKMLSLFLLLTFLVIIYLLTGTDVCSVDSGRPDTPDTDESSEVVLTFIEYLSIQTVGWWSNWKYGKESHSKTSIHDVGISKD